MRVLFFFCFLLVLAEFTASACNCRHCPSGGVCVGPRGSSARYCVCVTDTPMGRRRLKKQLGTKKYANLRYKSPTTLRKKTKKAIKHSNKKKRVNVRLHIISVKYIRE